MDPVSTALANARVGEACARWFGGSGTWGARLHSFDGIGFHTVLTGSPWLLDSSGVVARLHPGDLVLVQSGVEHALSLALRKLDEIPLLARSLQAPPTERHDLECLSGAYLLDRSRVHHFLRDLPPLLVVTPHPELAAIISLLRQDLSDPQPGSSVTRLALIDLLMVHALRIWQDAEPAVLDVSDEQVGVALRAMHASLEAPWTLQRLSERAGLSRTTFSRRFTEQTGRSPMAYLSAQRLTHAARLLADTRSPQASIAVRVGYTSEFAFANAFRREFGIPPGRYRRDHQRFLGAS